MSNADDFISSEADIQKVINSTLDYHYELSDRGFQGPKRSDSYSAIRFRDSGRSEYAKIFRGNSKEYAFKGIKVLLPLYQWIADAQIRPYSEGTYDSEIFIKHSLPNQHPKIYKQLTEQCTLPEIRNHYLEALTLGCLTELPGVNETFIPNVLLKDFPSRNDPLTPEILTMLELSDSLISIMYPYFVREAEYVLDSKFRSRGLDKYANEIGKSSMPTHLWDLYKDEKIAPFFQSKGLKSGFLNTDAKVAILHTRAIFYIGVILSDLYQKITQSLAFDENSILDFALIDNNDFNYALPIYFQDSFTRQKRKKIWQL